MSPRRARKIPPSPAAKVKRSVHLHNCKPCPESAHAALPGPPGPVSLKSLRIKGLNRNSRGGNLLATVYDTMAHYEGPKHAALVPPTCSKCGSHRTQVVGRSNDGKTLTVRCGDCGERSVVVTEEEGEHSGRREGAA